MTNPIYRQVLDECIDGWKHFLEALYNVMPDAFDDLMDGVKRHADSASYSNPPEQTE